MGNLSIRSNDVCSTGNKQCGSLPVLIGRDEFQPAIPWQVALQQRLPPLRRLRTILRNHNPPYNNFSAKGDNPLNSLSQPKGALQIGRGTKLWRSRRKSRFLDFAGSSAFVDAPASLEMTGGIDWPRRRFKMTSIAEAIPRCLLGAGRRCSSARDSVSAAAPSLSPAARLACASSAGHSLPPWPQNGCSRPRR